MFNELLLSRGGAGRIDDVRRRTAAIVGRMSGGFGLEPRILLASTPAAASFDAVDNFGVRQIKVDGTSLLVGGGFGGIGSQSGVDNGKNVATFVKNNGGQMRQLDGGKDVTMPFGLKFTKGKDASLLNFDYKIGPSDKFSFATMSLPMDSVRSFTWWRSSASSTLGRYDQNPFAYGTGDGPISIAKAPAGAVWGEIVGVDYTIRVTLTKSSRPMNLFFVEAPGIGVRNVEFSFGAVKKGETASASGTIQVFRTDASQLPRVTYESETPSFHQIGRRDGDGWSVRVGDTVNRYMTFGPGTTTLPAGNRLAVFTLSIDDVKKDNNKILTLDVYDGKSGRVLAKLDVSRKMFDAARQYKKFTLPFVAAPGQSIEGRVYWRGGADVKQDSLVFV